VLQTAAGWQATALASRAAETWNEGTPAEFAERLAAFVAKHGVATNRILLGVRSQAVLVAGFQAPPADQRDRRTLGYQLESRLPLAAEEMAADFLREGDHVLGVCIETKTWLPRIVALESRGLRVQSISPAALLALQSLLNEGDWNRADVVLWQDGSAVELWRMANGRIMGWQHLEADPAIVDRHLAVESLTAGAPLRVAIINGAELRVGLRSLERPEFVLTTRDTKPLAEHAIAQADAVLRGAETPWIELRRDELAAGDPYRAVRGSLHLLAAAAAIFLITLAAAFFVKDWQYRAELARLTDEQAQYFRSAFPNTRIPGAVVARMRSEHAKLKGSRNAAADIKVPLPAMRVLVELLNALPSHEAFAVRELRIEDGQIDLDLRLRQHASVNNIVAGLESRGFAVNAPATARQDDASVTCRIFGELQLAGAERAEGGP
jgi:type II secretory pathway component PulL